MGKSSQFMAIAALSLLISSCTPENRSPLSPDDREKLTQLKEVYWPQAYREQDTVLLDRILADEFQMIDAEGAWSTKKFELDYISKNKPTYDSFRFEIKRLDVFENGTAVVAGTGHISGTGDDGPYKMIYQSSNILIKRKGEWKAISSHVSGVNFLENN
jgi:ketosteroid isomerase-like protein